MRPVIASHITQHTLWQALTRDLPPLALPPAPIMSAALDSREINGGGLFAAFPGQETDGHLFVGNALLNGAQAVICEERGRNRTLEHGAVIVDCRTDAAGGSESPRNWLQAATDSLSDRQIVYIVDSTMLALQALGGFQRVHRASPELKVVGITGSVGKTSTKELTAAVLAQRSQTLHNKGNLNSEQGLPLTLLELSPAHEYAVLEMAMYALGEITTLCRLARPQIGVITNVGPSHLSRLGTIERIAQAKSELIQALPDAQDGGTAILNWDDELVRPMAEMTSARVFRYGLNPDADLWADKISGAGMEGIRFRFHYRPPDGRRDESLYVKVPLLGRHSVHTALRAAAVGLVEGLNWEEIVAGMQTLPGQLRLMVVPGINNCTVIDDTYNASPDSTVAALNLLNDLTPEPGCRRVAVLGPMLELGEYTDEGHKIVGRRAADVVNILLTVGDLGSSIGQEALNAGFNPDALFVVNDADEAIRLLEEVILPGDLVLAKGSRAVGMDRIVAAISLDEGSPATQEHSSKG